MDLFTSKQKYFTLTSYKLIFLSKNLSEAINYNSINDVLITYNLSLFLDVCYACGSKIHNTVKFVSILHLKLFNLIDISVVIHPFTNLSFNIYFIS